MTIVIPTSPIPSHPSIEVIMNTINKLMDYEELRECSIIIMADGIHPKHEHRRSAYQQYLSTLFDLFDNDTNITIHQFSEHTHQAEMLRKVLPMCDDLVFYVEHDTYVGGEIPFNHIMDLVRNSSIINQLRFHIFDRFIDEHQYLMIDKTPIEFNGVPVVRTFQWSQRPHIAKRDWYMAVLQKYFQAGRKTMIEDVMHGVTQTEYSRGNDLGLAIYAPDYPLRSFTVDGRQQDEKITEA